jgi:type VI protein secretion system component VasK
VTDEAPQVAEARRTADQARAKLMASVEELIDYGERLQRSLQPSHLARDAWEAAKSKSADVAEDAVDAVRKRPVMASSAVAALALFIAREPLMDLAAKLLNGKSKKVKKAAKPKVPVEKTND